MGHQVRLRSSDRKLGETGEVWWDTRSDWGGVHTSLLFPGADEGSDNRTLRLLQCRVRWSRLGRLEEYRLEAEAMEAGGMEAGGIEAGGMEAGGMEAGGMGLEDERF